jgi:hypothetical protein
VPAKRFRRDADKWLKHADKQITAHARRLALEAYDRITEDRGKTLGVALSQQGHPKDTGTAIRGWNVSVGSPRKASPGSVSTRDFKLGETIYVSHSDLAGRPPRKALHFVEFGTSRIAPRLWITGALLSMGLRPDWLRR